MLRVMGCFVGQRKGMAPDANMSGKHVVVTGASLNGIGFYTAQSLLLRGAKVTIAARSRERGQQALDALAEDAKAGATEVKLAICDVSSLESVRSCAAEMQTSPFGAVDVLVDNAGANFDKALTSPDGVELTFATCALGHHLLNHLLQPRRIVWVTGDIYALAKPPARARFPGKGTPAYCNACLGRLLLAQELHRWAVKSGNGLEVVAVHPGVIASEFAKVGEWAKAVFARMALTPEQGAQASIYAATCPSSDFPQDTIYYHNKHRWMTLKEGDMAADEVAAKELFAECDTLCGIQR